MSAGRAAVLGVLVCGASLVRADGPGVGPGSPPLSVEPARVEIGLLYSGVDLTVSAETEPGVEVAVLVSGSPAELVMREQARRWGLFWAPAGEVTFDDVPSLYLLETTVEPEKLAPAHVLEKLGIGYTSLRTRLGEQGRHDLARELIVLKESEGLFSSTVAKDDGREATASGGPVYRTVVHVPPRAPAGTYSVQLCTFREGRLVSRADGAFELEQAGFVAFVSSLAEAHGLAYGVFAVVVAIASGLLVGFLFGSARKKT